MFSPQDFDAIQLSIFVATTATLLALPLAIATSYLLVFIHIPGKTCIDGIINLPLVLPPVVVGYLLLLFFGNESGIGSFLSKFDIHIVFSIYGAIIASTVVGFPLFVRSIRIGMEDIDEHILQAARSLGASWWDALFTVILPLSIRPILAGMTLMFARSLGEFGATIILAGNIPGLTQTIPLAIYDYTNVPGGEKMALSLCLVSIGISFTVLMLNESLSRKVKHGGKR